MTEINSMNLPDFIVRLLEIEPFDENVYIDIDLNRLAVFGLNRLSQMNITFTFERISVLLFRLFPEKFSMAEFKMYPDLTRINRALLQLNPRDRNWGKGSVKNGYQLNENGVEVVEQTKKLLQRSPDEVVESAKKRKFQRSDKSRDRGLRFMYEIERSPLFLAYKSNSVSENSLWEFFDLLHGSEESSKDTLNQNLRKLESFAKGLKRNDILIFFKWIRKEFHEYL